MKTKESKLPVAKQILGQTIYYGPHVPWLALHRGNGFRNGIHESFYKEITQCPAFGELFIPISQLGAVMRELDLDLSGNVRGARGKFVTFYRETQRWITERVSKSKTPTPKGAEIKHA